MIEKAIENWLINTNELNYQLAFCQILLLKGEKVIYNSSHRPMEQGKDIITINSDGNCCAYQLKTGNVNLKEWRNISGEIRDLMELPIIHPSANKKVSHKAFLVTNGEISDEVRFQIDQMNSDNEKKERNFSYLDVITKDVLLKEFIDAQGKFMPKELEDFHLFLELFLNDGADFLPKEKYFAFLHRTIFQEIPKRKSDTINTILSSIIINSYLLNPYQREKNYYALFEAWTLLGGFIITYSIKAFLKENYWIESLNLIVEEITRNVSLLKEEVLKKDNFIEGNPLADGGMIYNARMTIVLGILSTFEIHLHKTRTEYNQDKKILELIKENIGKFFFWGESAFPFFFFTIKYLELIGEDEIAYDLLKKSFLRFLPKILLEAK